MEHFCSDWTFKPITMLHVNAPSGSRLNCELLSLSLVTTAYSLLAFVT